MSEQGTPSHDILPIPENLDEATLEFTLSHLAHVALDFELPAEQNQIDPDDPESIDRFVHNLEEQIKLSQRTSDEKRAQLRMLKDLVDYYSQALQQTREA